jgi:carbon-monoxide dehydrogenase large subunit
MSLIGRALPRSTAARLAAGRGHYTDDLVLPHMVHVAFVRSAHARARIKSIDTGAAAAASGVVAVVTGADLARVCKPFVCEIANLPAFKPPPQYPLAVGEAAWQGEAVAMVAAESRAEAEDAAELVQVEWEPLPAIADPARALAPSSAPAHTALPHNLAAALEISTGEVNVAFAGGSVVAEHEFEFGRVTGVPLEPRSIVAAFDPGEGHLTVHHSHQSPYQMQDVLSRHLGLPENRVRVISPDIGGAFGIKLHAYADEVAAAALAVILKRPVKCVLDRVESMASDVHAREARVRGRVATDADGRIAAVEVDVLCGMGAYSTYPRSSLGEGMQAMQMAFAPYRVPALHGRVRFAYQNKAPTGAYRAVGQPLACAVTEQLLDIAAVKLGLDPAEIRRRNHLRPDDFPCTTPGGLKLGSLSLDACLTALLARMDYTRLRREQADLRVQRVYRGIGLANFVELTAVGADLYGPAGVRISAHESCIVRLEPSGTIRCRTSATDQGQGTLAGIAQVIADILGVDPRAVTVVTGDTADGTYGGGAWASRGLAIGGEAALKAARELRRRILAVASAVLQADPTSLSLADGHVQDATGANRISIAEISSLVHFRQGLLPPGVDWEMTVTRAFVLPDKPYIAANGVQGCHLEVDVETGEIHLLGFWVAEDCGTVVNPLLVDSQLRGGVVQGIGAALYEHCAYDPSGQLLSGSLADYLLPLAPDLPDIDIVHLDAAEKGAGLGVKGVGEAGTVGAAAAVWCAVNDALAPLGARVWRQPFSPAHILEALARARP